MTDPIGTWYGKPISEMQREGLLEVIAHMAKDLAKYRAPENREAAVLGRIEQLKRGAR